MVTQTREQVAMNQAEKYFGKHIDVTSKIYDTARFADTVKEVHMAPHCFIGDFCLISVPQLVMDEGSQINSGTRIVGREPVTIGKNTVVSYGCTLLTTSDSTEAEYMNDASPSNKRILRSAPIGLGDKVFIGSHSIIMPGVNIVEGVVVRAFSYVNRSLTRQHTIYASGGYSPRGYVGT